MLYFHSYLSQIAFCFSFNDFFFDTLDVHKCIVQFPQLCQLYKFFPMIDLILCVIIEYTFMSIFALVKTCYGLAYCLSQRMFCVHLIRVFFHLSLGKVFDKCIRSSWLSQGFVMQSCPTLRGLMDCSPPGSTVHGFPKEEHWSGLPFPSPGDLEDPGAEPGSSALQADSLLTEPPEANCFCSVMSDSLRPRGL